MSLKEILYNIEYINYERKTNTYKSAWYPLTSSKTGRTLSKQEIRDNKTDFCEVEYKDDKFRLTRKI